MSKLGAAVMLTLALSCLAQPLGADTTDGDSTDQPPTFSDEQIKFFEQKVFPILKKSCHSCHAGPKAKAGLRLTSRAGLMSGGDSGPAIDLEDPASSLLIEAINYESYEMPPKAQLPREQIDMLTQWAKMGLPWTKGASEPDDDHEENKEPQVNEETMRFWSFQPVQRPVPPDVTQQEWLRNPIDAFVLSKLEEAGLTPSRTAENSTLLRRAYYDLIGLPPSPEEVREFLSDASPRAFERVIVRLLNSPHYGEKWGRHWLDLVRYAESNSYERDGTKPFVWRYRDYVIRSLNEDKPYDQFIIEQLAGDELDDASHETLIATGYYRLGIWDDEPSDPEQAHYDDLDDILATTSQVFLGLTMNCARCHNHKIDAIPHRDYYRMLAFFNGLNRYGVRSPQSVARFSLREIATEDEKRRQQHEIDKHQKKVKDVRQEISKIESIVKKDFQPVEFEEFKHEMNRVPLVKKRVSTVISERDFERYVELKKQQKKLRRFKPTALSQILCVTEIGPKPRDTYILFRGSPHARGEKVEPGFPSVLAPPEPEFSARSPRAKTSGRRLALANWIASKDNPLTARVMANRLWHYHFGRGIVRTPNKLGRHGFLPTHPELLDWLASEFVARGWHMKAMHKLIMMSNTYQMSSRSNPKALAQDPENNLIWRFRMRRLAAEEVRDSILAVNGTLNPKMFGPSIYPIIEPEVLAGQSRPGADWGTSSDAERHRRSIYIHIKRSLPVPIMATYDAADADSTCPVRFSTTQPTQSLAMMNGKFLQRQAKAFARLLRTRAGPHPIDQVRLALERALQRDPSSDEINQGVGLLHTLREKHNVDADAALDYYCLVCLNLNELIYLD